jgi:hypothetical protein
MHALNSLSHTPTEYLYYREDSTEPDLEDSSLQNSVFDFKEQLNSKSYKTTKQILEELEYSEDVMTKNSWDYLLL